jgi:hypothetical protein
VTARETQLQPWLRALPDLVVDARENLTPDVFIVWVELLCSIAASEASRCRNCEMLHRRAA